MATEAEAKKAAEDLMDALGTEAEKAEPKGGLTQEQVKDRLRRLRQILKDHPNLPAPTKMDVEACIDVEESMLT
jgi:hypothetical protein